MSYSHVTDNWKDLQQRLQKAQSRSEERQKPVTLVAVSKLHPKEAVIEAYKAGQRVFGENYVQELFDKASDPEVLATCPDIEWHFIGHLQSNKVNKLISVPNLHLVQTIDSEKLAAALDKVWSSKGSHNPLRVLVQINTSGEENKSGTDPKTFIDLVEYVRKSCPHLEFVGLMTIGAYDYDTSQGPNPDFVKLLQCRDDVSQKLGISIADIEVSMGMSADFEQAVEMGSTIVRVGTTIFGSRPSKS